MLSYECTHKVQYYETDQMKIVHHSNYIRWFEEGRTDFLEQAGYPYKEMEDAGILSPVLEVSAKYRSMVRYGDTVIIRSTLESFNGIKLVFDYEVRDALTGEIRTTGKSRHCFLNSQGRPVSLKKDFPDVYAKLACLPE